MNIHHSLRLATLSATLILLSSCIVDKFEARLQTDLQCKSVMNAKTGALMPCPGTDKEFYKSMPTLSVASPKATQITEAGAPSMAAISTPKPILPHQLSASHSCIKSRAVGCLVPHLDLESIEGCNEAYDHTKPAQGLISIKLPTGYINE